MSNMLISSCHMCSVSYSCILTFHFKISTRKTLNIHNQNEFVYFSQLLKTIIVQIINSEVKNTILIKENYDSDR